MKGRTGSTDAPATTRSREAASEDTIWGGDGDDTLRGNREEDNIWGGRGNDILYGGEGRDNLAGQAGKDKLYGGAGRNVLIGGADNDKLWGGADGDIFEFLIRAGFDNGDDTVFDSEDGDKIRFNAHNEDGTAIDSRVDIQIS